MGLRFEVLLYSQLLGMLLLACQYDINVIFSSPTTRQLAVEKIKNFFSHNVSASGFVSMYVGVLISVAILATLKRLYTNRTPLDLISLTIGLFASIWFSSHYISQERLLYYLEEGEVIQHIPKLAMGHTIAGFSLFTIIILSLLASPIEYLWDPIELIFLHVLGGILVIDFSFDFDFIINNSLEEHYLCVTGIAGSYLMSYIIPLIMLILLMFTIFRVYHHFYENLVTLIFAIGGSVLFLLFIVPVEKDLAASGKPSYDSQKMIVISHFVLEAVVVFETTFKWTLYCLRPKPGHSAIVVDVPPAIKGLPVVKSTVVKGGGPKDTTKAKQKIKK